MFNDLKYLMITIALLTSTWAAEFTAQASAAVEIDEHASVAGVASATAMADEGIEDTSSIIDKQYTTRQRYLISEMKFSMAHKITSKNHGDEFVKLLANSNYVGAFARFTGVYNGQNLEISGSILFKSNDEQTKSYFEMALSALKKSLPKIKHNFDFFSSLGDGFSLPAHIVNFAKEHIILITADKPFASLGLVSLIPDYFIINPNHASEIKKTKDQNLSFLDRKPVGKFIGSQTGGHYSMNNIGKIIRLNAVHLAKDNPELLDIKFVDYRCQAGGAGEQEYIDYMRRTFGNPAPREPQESLARYRYPISFDGNISAFKRPEIMMHSGSVPLIQTKFDKFWTSLLVDGENYIKIHDDLSNLLDTVRFLNDNPEKAQAIAHAAQDLANDVLTPEFFDKYFVELFNEMGRLQNLPS